LKTISYFGREHQDFHRAQSPAAGWVWDWAAMFGGRKPYEAPLSWPCRGEHTCRKRRRSRNISEEVVIISHQAKTPRIAASAYIAPNAVVCGDVTIGGRLPHHVRLAGHRRGRRDRHR
jgi:hypothetical protein